MKNIAFSAKQYVNVSVFLFGFFLLALPRGYLVGPIMLMFAALPNLLFPQTYRINTEQRRIVVLLALYFAIQCVCIFFFDTEWYIKNIELSSRSIMGLILFLYLLKVPPSFSVIGVGFGIGAAVACGIAIYQKLIMAEHRAFFDRMPIQSGNISLTLGLISLSFLIYFYRNRQHLWVLFFSLATFSGIFGSLLSGSRGGWILLPAILFVFYRMHRQYLSRRARNITMLLAASLLLTCFIPQTGVPERVIAVKEDLNSYFSKEWQGDSHENSSGTRLLLWKSAWDSFKDKPILGWGINGIRAHQKEQVEEKKLSYFLYLEAMHAHNQYLDEMAKHGIIGLFALLMLFLVPLREFRRYFKNHKNRQCQAMASAGIMLILSSMDYCLTQAFLNHNSGVIFFFCTLVIFLAFIMTAPKREDNVTPIP